MVPEMVPFGGAQVLEKAMKSKGFGAFGLSEGSILGYIFTTPDFGVFQNFEELDTQV